MEDSEAEAAAAEKEEEDDEKEDENPSGGFRLKFHISLKNSGDSGATKKQEKTQEKNLDHLHKDLEKAVGGAQQGLKDLGGALTELQQLKAQADQIDKLLAEFEALLGDDSDEDSDEDLFNFSDLFSSSSEEEEVEKEKKKKEEEEEAAAHKEKPITMKPQADADDYSDEDSDDYSDEDSGEDVDFWSIFSGQDNNEPSTAAPSAAGDDHVPTYSEYQEKNKEFVTLLSELEDSSIRVVSGSPDEPLGLQLTVKDKVKDEVKDEVKDKVKDEVKDPKNDDDDEEEANESLERFKESKKHLERLRKENEKLEKFFAQLDDSAESESSAEALIEENDVSLVDLGQSLKNLYHLKDETERVKDFLDGMGASSPQRSGAADKKTLVDSLQLFDESIRNLQHLKKKTEEYDELVDRLNDPFKDEAEMQAEVDDQRLDDSMKNLQRLKEESEQMQKFLANLDQPSEDEPSIADQNLEFTIKELKESLANLKRLKEQNELMERFFSQMDFGTEGPGKLTPIDKSKTEESLSVFDQSLRNLEQLKTKTKELFDLFTRLNDPEHNPPTEDLHDSEIDIKRLKGETEHVREFLVNLDQPVKDVTSINSPHSEFTIGMLKESLQNFQKLKRQNEMMERFFTGLSNGYPKFHKLTPIDKVKTEESLSVFDESIIVAEQLKQKAQELDRLMMQLEDTQESDEDAHDAQQQRFDQSLKNIQKLKEENQELNKFLDSLARPAGASDTSSWDALKDSDTTLGDLKDSLLHFKQLKQQNQEVERFYAQLTPGHEQLAAKLPAAVPKDTLGSLAVFDESIRHLERLKKKTHQLNRLMVEIENSDDEDPYADGDPAALHLPQLVTRLQQLQQLSAELEAMAHLFQQPQEDFSGEPFAGHQTPQETIAALDESIRNLQLLKQQSQMVDRAFKAARKSSAGSTEEPVQDLQEKLVSIDILTQDDVIKEKIKHMDEEDTEPVSSNEDDEDVIDLQYLKEQFERNKNTEPADGSMETLQNLKHHVDIEESTESSIEMEDSTDVPSVDQQSSSESPTASEESMETFLNLKDQIQVEEVEESTDRVHLEESTESNSEIEDSTDVPSVAQQSSSESLMALGESVDDLGAMKENYEALDKLISQFSSVIKAQQTTVKPDGAGELLQPDDTAEENVETTTLPSVKSHVFSPSSSVF